MMTAGVIFGFPYPISTFPEPASLHNGLRPMNGGTPGGTPGRRLCVS
jgi:hypothetical protein